VRVINLVETATLTSVFLLLFFPYLIRLFPCLINADHIYFGMGTSMTPTIQEGDLVAVTEKGLNDIEVGDILSFKFEEIIISHRLIEIREDETSLFRMKGDGNESPDPILFDASQIIGKVVAIYPYHHLFASYGIILLIAGVLLAVSLWERLGIDLNDVFLCLIISLSMAGIVGGKIND